MARTFTHPNIGQRVKVEQIGADVRITLSCSTRPAAADVVDLLMKQLRAGFLEFRLMGKPTSIKEGD